MIGSVGTEPEALRSTLEGFNYRVDTHWIGSKLEFIKIISGEIPTANDLILSCHGSDDGIIIDGEPALSINDIKKYGLLNGKSIVSLGCSTGRASYAESFLFAGASSYIAPREDIDGNACLLFAYHLIYFLKNGLSLKAAFQKSFEFEEESKLFAFYEKKNQ